MLVDGMVVGTFTPSGTSYQSYSTAAFTVTAGSHTIAFQGLDTAGGDNTAFVDRPPSPTDTSEEPTNTLGPTGHSPLRTIRSGRRGLRFSRS